MKMKKYDHGNIEKKWQKEWEKQKLFEVKTKSKKPKFFSLIEFPYPSGQGLHVGHVRSNTAMDVISRKRRMEGFNVLYPIGWDAFGLPTENYAIKTGKDPRKVTKENTDTFRKQLKSLGFSFDWSREINTTDPAYYKWTQWIFLQMFKKGLAYKKKMTINWCPKDKIGLANEEVINGCCERCGTPVEKREKEQWMLAITKYADRLDKDLDDVNYLPQIKTQQRNWIGKSEGAEIEFTIEFSRGQKPGKIPVFTTRPDTLFGANALILSPEHLWVTLALDKDHTGVLDNADEVREYVHTAKKKTEIDRTDTAKEKTGMLLKGVWAINPANKEKIPVFVADYVLSDYGTGAVMSVPAHDERDFAFAQKYNLPIKEVVIPLRIDHKNPHVKGKEIVFRKGVMGIVKNKKTGKYLGLKWKKQPWTTFIMGGIEGNESPAEAAQREIEEETGYKNLKLIKVLGGPVQTEFFAAHKDINRIAHTWMVLFELENEERDEISKEESEKHEMVWLDKNDVNKGSDFMTHAEMDIVLDRMNNGVSMWSGGGVLVNCGDFTGMKSEEAKKKITEYVDGKIVTTYKLRDWVFSRQRYWGEPIPLVYCDSCGWVPVPEKNLPVELPKVKQYMPTDTGESPLAHISSWVNTKCPQCGGKATRETDTMPNWAGSSWYYLRYTDPKNKKAFAGQDALSYWIPVDWYNGGMEHTTLHLLYSRFWHKFLYDQKLVKTKEPYAKRTSHGLILAEGGEKMSKSKGNVVNPDDVVKTWGADSFRLFEMFMGPFDQPVSWSTENIIGVRRFLERVWRLSFKVETKKVKENSAETDAQKALTSLLHKTIKKVTDDIEGMRFNTVISALMVLVNEMERMVNTSNALLKKNDFETFLLLLSPFAPHITEELWRELGNKKTIAYEKWPQADKRKIQEDTVTIVVQVNGKVRGQLKVPVNSDEGAVFEHAKSNPDIQKWLGETKPKRIIYVANRLLNVVF